MIYEYIWSLGWCWNCCWIWIKCLFSCRLRTHPTWWGRKPITWRHHSIHIFVTIISHRLLWLQLSFIWCIMCGYIAIVISSCCLHTPTKNEDKNHPCNLLLLRRFHERLSGNINLHSEYSNSDGKIGLLIIWTLYLPIQSPIYLSVINLIINWDVVRKKIDMKTCGVSP